MVRGEHGHLWGLSDTRGVVPDGQRGDWNAQNYIVSCLFDFIRILHECEVWIENSVPRITVWHHEAVPSDAKQWSWGTEFSVRTEHSIILDSFSCIPFSFKCLILKVAFYTTHSDVDVGHFLKIDITVTSQWRQPNDKVTWHPIQPVQTEFRIPR